MAINPATAIVGKTLWLRAKDHAGSGGSTITSWADQSGTGLSIPAAGAPTVVASGTPGGGKSVAFATSSDQFIGNAAAPPIGASSYNSTSLLPTNLIDGSTSTRWATASGQGTGWVRMFLTTAHAATQYTLTPWSSVLNDAPKDFTFEGSNDDGATWTVLDTQTGVTWPTSAAQTFTFSNSTAYRSYRLNVTLAGSLVQLSEFSIGGVTPDASGEMWMVIKGGPAASNGNNAPNTGSGTLTSAIYRGANGDIYDITGRATRKQFTPTMTIGSTWRLVRVTSNGTWTYYLDGTVQSTETVAAGWRNNPLIRNVTGEIAEILVVSGIRSSGEVADLITYFNTEHGLSVPGGSVGIPSGSASGSFTWAGAAAGVRAPKATAAGAFTWVGAASGAAAYRGTASGVFSWAGAAVGAAPAMPGAGVAAGSFEWVGSATGTAPALGVNSGAAVGTFNWDGNAVGKFPAKGDAAGSFEWVGAAEGVAPGTWVPGDTLELSAPSPRFAALASFEVFVPPSEVLTLSARSVRVATLRIHPVAVPLPTGVVDRPLMRRAHLMDPKTPTSPRKQGDELRAVVDGDDGYNYPIQVAPVGRLRVFASGVDVTYLTGAPTTVSEWSFAKPFGPQAASFTVPLPEWNYPGPYAGPHGNLPIFWGDAPIEIALEDTNGDLHHLWEGYTAEESDTAAPGQTGVTFNCEGTFQQAAHWPWDPPAVMDERDYGHVIADALNGVPNRRWAKIKRFTTGRVTTERGDSSQSVLAYVADLLGKVFDDDGNQLVLKRVGPYRYELAFAQPVVVEDFTFTKGSPGFDMTLARPHSARRDMVFARGIAPDGGFWMNRYFPGLAVAAPPVYPVAGFANITVGTTDADTVGGNGVTTWQRRMRELGYPVTVDGVMNSADTKWVLKIQKDRGITVDGSLGPQTWAATWEGPQSTPETATVRLPLDVKDIARQYDRDAAGAIIRENPVFDKQKILHATPEVDAGTNIKKSTFRPMAAQIREREASPGYVGTLTATGVDPKEPDTSRLFIADGANVLVEGHHWGTVVQVADVTHTPTSTRMTVDSGARGQALVDAILSRQRDVRRSLSGKSTRVTDRGTLNASQLGQYESESPAGKYPRTAINGDAGLWTVRCIYVAEQGLARFRLTSSPDAEIVTAIFGKKVTPNFIAARVANPLSDDSGWYDHEKELKAAGLINVAGTPDNPGGYWPRQKADGGALTGVQAAGNLSLKSERGGFFWVAVYTSKSAFVEGEFDPEVSTS